LRYFAARLERGGVEQKLGVEASVGMLATGYDHVVVATGVRPRKPVLPGIELPGVVGYADLIEGRVEAGNRVAIIGAGGIGFDVAELLTHEDLGAVDEHARFVATWGIDLTVKERGGLIPPAPPQVPRSIWLLQRKDEFTGKRLGKTTGWIRRALLERRGVHMWAGVAYERIVRAGDTLSLHLSVRGVSRVLNVDTIVVCAGQEPEDALLGGLRAAGVAATAVGGARVAAELDATRAIEEGVRLAARL
jgi:2,4-dienoyl-CoA reductase (NADPH2)